MRIRQVPCAVLLVCNASNEVFSFSACSLCFVLDIIYDKRPIQRFWFLEVVARMPYFSYISMLHLYESLGWWRAGAELRRVSCHFSPCSGSWTVLKQETALGVIRMQTDPEGISMASKPFMPYISYISLLHLYESLDWWHASLELRLVSSNLPWRQVLTCTCASDCASFGQAAQARHNEWSCSSPPNLYSIWRQCTPGSCQRHICSRHVISHGS